MAVRAAGCYIATRSMPFPPSSAAPRFLRESIRSLQELEAILLLHRHPAKWWSAEQIALELSLTVESAARVLEALAGRNLLDVRVGTALAYCCAPIDDHAVAMLSEVAGDPAAAREVVIAASPGLLRFQQN